jgi:hypothetical protein
LTGLLCAAPSPATPGSHELVLRGHAVCLDEAGALHASGKECPDAPAGGWALRTGDGTLHRLSSRDPRVRMLTDVRVRSRELQIRAWREDDGDLAIVNLHSIIDGRLHEPHYYCDVCAIRGHTPGPCWCCQAPFEFREPAVEGQPVAPASR